MCLPGQLPVPPRSAAQAAAMATAALGWLAAADPTALTSGEQAECLRALERATSMHTAARAKVLAAFCAGGGYEDDGHGSARTWLKWQTRITPGAAAGAIGWMRRLSAHPAVRIALADGAVSESWARQICVWSDLLPERHRADADQILLGAAAGGAELADLGALADQMRRRLAPADGDDDGFDDRRVRLEQTFGGAGKLDGDLTPRCAAALAAVLDALGKRAGPEDQRSKDQRHHDALEEACRRLIASGCLPERAGQPTQIMLHMNLGQLRGLPGAAAAEAAWGAPAAAGDDCDAAIVPVVTGHVDPDVLDRLAAALLNTAGLDAAGQPGGTGEPAGRTQPAGAGEPAGRAQPAGAGQAAGNTQPGGTGQAAGDPARAGRRARVEEDRRARADRAARQIVIRNAADLLSGPAGLAAYLRTRLAPGIIASASLPLDIGAVTETIPVHLRRAVAVRDRHCRFPGCDQPVVACQPHHIIPRAQGGPTCLTNMLLLCTFHHLVAVHRWGWGIVLLPDGTVTATSPDGSLTYRSHGPPTPAAA
jgi:Domain of unknown function (DUF222)